MNPGRPLLWPTLGFLGGVGAGLAHPAAPAWLPALFALLLLPRFRPVAFLAAGWIACAGARAAPLEVPRESVVLEGRIVMPPPESYGELERFRLERDDGLRVEVMGSPTPWPLSLGDAVRVEAQLRRPLGPANPGGRDRAEALAAAGVPFTARAVGPVVRRAPPSPAAVLEVARGRFAAACERFLPGREAALLRAIGAGDRSALDEVARRSFARSGLAHILAVSGMHLVVIVFGLWKLLRALLLRWTWLAARVDPGAVAAAACVPWAAAYALATGANPPVLRAAFAAAVILVGVLLRREPDGLNTLALTALALLAAEPATALDPSFQLSFAAVAGLILWAGRLRARIPVAPPSGTWRARIIEPILEGGCATLAASIATAPVLVFHFRQLPLLGLPANLAAIPLGAGLTVLATAGGVGACAHPLLAAPFLWAAWPLARGLGALSDAAAAPRWGTIGLGSPGVIGAGACAGFLLLAGGARRGWRAAAIATAVASLLAAPPLRAAAARARGGLEVIFLDVGQGDGTLLRLPDGAAVLIDGGGATGHGADPGARDVVPLLRDLGVRRLAAVFASHPHPDHVLGLGAVLDAFPVENAFGNGDPGEGPAAAVIARLSPRALLPGEAWERAGVRFEAIGGPRDGLSANDASLVLRVRYGRVTFLFTGDVEAAGEAGAVRAGGLRADVVKIPHHGSQTSSSAPFAAAVSPTLAVVSVGADNRFGFPRREALARWEASGARILRTDGGAVRLFSDGDRVREVPAETVLDPLATLSERP